MDTSAIGTSRARRPAKENKIRLAMIQKLARLCSICFNWFIINRLLKVYEWCLICEFKSENENHLF
jgi:hypothetical protein